MSKLLSIGKWCVIIVMCFIFLFSGFFKLNGDPDTILAFQKYGFPYWFQVLIGAGELVGGLGLLFQKYFRFAAYSLAVIMIGATFTHLLHGETSIAAIPCVLFVTLLILSLKKIRKE